MDDSASFENSTLAGELRRDTEAIQKFGERYPDQFVGSTISGHAHISILLWGKIQPEQEHELRSLLIHGDALEIEYSRNPPSRLDDIQDELRRTSKNESPGALRGWGRQWDAVRIDLRADQIGLAERLKARWGDAVEITLGFFPYPSGGAQRPIRPAPRPRREPSVTNIVIPDLCATLELTSTTIVAGQDGYGAAHLHNTGSSMIEFDTGVPLVGSVLRSLTGPVAGGFNGAVAGVGKRVALASDDETDLPVIFGTASVQSEDGYALPTGRYIVKVLIPVRSIPEDNAGVRDNVVEAFASDLTVVEK